MRRLIVLPVLLVALARISKIDAQDTPEGVTFTSEANLVIVDVVVRDKKGNVIPNLKKSDFTVLEDGKPVALSVFEFQKLDDDTPVERIPVPAVKPGPAAVTPATPVAPVIKSPVGTPKPIIRFQDRRLVAMLFDFSAMPTADQARVQESALKFIKEQMKPADLVAIMSAATGPIKVDQDFTDDKDRLTEVIKKFQVGVASELADAGANGDDTDTPDNGAAFTADETEFNIFNTDRKLVTLESAARMLAGFPEKKALIYFTSGISQSGFDNRAQLQSAINTAKKSNVALYPIDASGLVATAPAGDASAAGGRGASAFQGGGTRSRGASREGGQETLSTLAADTGGKLFVDDNDLSLGMEKARDDISSYYILGYYSTNGKLDGKFRRRTIRLTDSKLEAKLDYSTGYFGKKEFHKFTSTDKENQLQEALMLGDPLTDLSLTAEIDYFRLAKDRYFIPFSVKIPGSEIALAKSKGNAKTELEFIGQLRDQHDKLINVVRDGIEIKLAEKTATQLSASPLVYDTGFIAPPGTYILKFLARENETGKMGSYETKFTIPDLTPDLPKIKTSSVVWSSQRQKVSESLAFADPKKKLLDSDPLIAEGQKLIPSITHVFRKDQNLYVYMEVYDPGIDADRKAPSVSATLAFYRGKTKTFESEPIRLDSFVPKRGQTLPVQFQAALSQLATGRYTAQVNLIDEAGKRFGFQRTEIVVMPAAKAAAASPLPPPAE